jgi:hypothetical protein
MPPSARPLLDVGELDSLGLRPLPDLHAIEDDALAGARIAAQLLARLLEGEALDRIGLVPVAQGGAERSMSSARPLIQVCGSAWATTPTVRSCVSLRSRLTT